MVKRAILLAAALCMISSPALAFEYTADGAGQCDTVASAAAKDIFWAKKLKVDQEFYSERDHRVKVDSPSYKARMRSLESEKDRNNDRLSGTCQRHFRTDSERWLLSWVYPDNFRFGSGVWH
jgi:hypothetical protein